MSNIAYKFKLLPNKEQAFWLSQAAGSTRWLWNYMLDLNMKTYKAEKKFVFKYSMNYLIPALKKEYPWLKNTPSQSLQHRCACLDTALTSVWRSGFGFPKFKSKHRSKDSFCIPQSTNQQIKISDSYIVVPKIGPIKWKMHRAIPQEAKVKSITISKDVDTWFVSVLLEIPDVDQKLIDKNKIIGIDLGISSFAIYSDGTKIESPKFLKQKAAKLAKYQRKMARKQLGSANRAKACIKVAKIHQEIRNSRANWLHQLSNKLTNEYDLICLEDLKIKDLVSKKKKQKSLNRAIHDQGWGIFVYQVKYKAKNKGKTISQIDTYAPSSKTCSCCGHKIGKLPLDIRGWTCPSCGSVLDRDLNAATNILFWGTALVDPIRFEVATNTGGMSEINACGDPLSGRSNEFDDCGSMKQEACGSLVHR